MPSGGDWWCRAAHCLSESRVDHSSRAKLPGSLRAVGPQFSGAWLERIQAEEGIIRIVAAACAAAHAIDATTAGSSMGKRLGTERDFPGLASASDQIAPPLPADWA